MKDNEEICLQLDTSQHTLIYRREERDHVLGYRTVLDDGKSDWTQGELIGRNILTHPHWLTPHGLTSLENDKQGKHDKKVLDATLALMIAGETVDLMSPIRHSGTLRLLSFNDEEILPVYRHTAAHVMGYALRTLYPKLQLAIGPPIDNGFYYDFDNQTLTHDDFKAIENEMRRLIKKKYKNERFEISRERARTLFKNDPYKLELIQDLGKDEVISYYQMGAFIDLCRGPHLPDISRIKGFALNKLTGAYWRGNEKNKMLTRLYALAFRDQDTLKHHLKTLAEMEKYDHNKIGRELGLFISDERVGQGLPLFTHKGTLVKRALQDVVEREEKKRGYLHTLTPLLAKSDLYKTSGHWEHYKQAMFVIPDGDKELALRPMTCPFHFSLYNSQKHSYKDLPIRYAETSILFRNEASGEMHGLTRVRQFTLSDGHIICRPDQVEEEFENCLDLLQYFLGLLAFTTYTFRLSKWDPQEAGKKFVDAPQRWEETEAQMRHILKKQGVTFVEAIGEAAFYGPKLDVQTKNVYGKEDTLLTVQIDFVQPERFAMSYQDANDQKAQPLVIHRASIGCYERTIAMLLEQCRGKLPFWLCPEQIVFLPVHPKLYAYTEELVALFNHTGFHVTFESCDESLGKRIRQARKKAIPYMVIIGEQEQTERTLAIRTRSQNNITKLSQETFLGMCQKMKENHLPYCLLDKTYPARKD